MTPSEIETNARRRLNAVDDSFWSSEEIIEDYIYACELELARRALCVQKTDTSLVSVADQEDYTIPSGVLRIKRVTYDGEKLKPIDEAQNDTVSISNPSSVTGVSDFYRIWGSTISLTPVPSEAGKTIKIWHYGLPDRPTNTSTLDTPAEYHTAIANYGVPALMAQKEIGDTRAGNFQMLWEKSVREIIAVEKKRRRGDRLARVKREEDLEITNLGPA